MIEYPLPPLGPMTLVRQAFPRPRVEDVGGQLQRELAASGVRLKRGGRYAIAVGSRGIANLTRLVRRVIDWVKASGASPFIVPAMGSHGGATAQGQRAVIESYGITEEAMGAPILSSMDVVELPRAGLELETYFDKHAAGADGTIIINRVKPHTCYHGQVESGLLKMLVIGLGKHKQALAIHQRQTRGMLELLPQVARNVLRHGNVILGVAVVENAYEETAALRALPAGRFIEEEPLLLEMARANMPSLPVDELDVLVVDEMGKNISGVGMDTSIIGRIHSYGFPEPDRPKIRIIVARDLTAESHGNAIGMGLADIITRKLADKIDWNATYENTVTNGFLDRGKMPIVAQNDAQAMAIAWRAAGSLPPETFRMARIVNTMRMGEILVSGAVLKEIRGRKSLEIVRMVEKWDAEI